MKKISTQFHEHEVELLEREALNMGISKNELIRLKALSYGARQDFTPADLAQLVSDANRECNIPRGEVERLVNFVFIKILGAKREAIPAG
jgi:hypothetical protein